MHPGSRWALAIAGVIAACAFLVPGYVYLASEAIIQRRYPLPPVTEPSALPQPTLLRGAHLAKVAGCNDCHGTNLDGRLTDASGPLPVWSANLRLPQARVSDAVFERAVRRGLAEGATTLWGMPSANYTYMSENDMTALFAYVQSLPPGGPERPPPRFDRRARLALLEGQIAPDAITAFKASSSIDLGPRYDGGRYLARVTCGECHGTDLNGTARAPNLDTVSRYGRSQFFNLLRRGWGAGGRRLPEMGQLAVMRFHGFADYEIMALYDYLDARAHAPAALVARAAAEEARERAAHEARLSNTQ
jgi:mono/diheme cytochrome c family protein